MFLMSVGVGNSAHRPLLLTGGCANETVDDA